MASPSHADISSVLVASISRFNPPAICHTSALHPRQTEENQTYKTHLPLVGARHVCTIPLTTSSAVFTFRIPVAAKASRKSELACRTVSQHSPSHRLTGQLLDMTEGGQPHRLWRRRKPPHRCCQNIPRSRGRERWILERNSGNTTCFVAHDTMRALTL